MGLEGENSYTFYSFMDCDVRLIQEAEVKTLPKYLLPITTPKPKTREKVLVEEI